MYYPDLTPYEYGHTEPSPGVLNIGWLSLDHPFERGAVDGQVVRALQRMIASPVNLSAGFHICDLCPPLQGLQPSGRLDGSRTGNGEIRVLGTTGITYVAPVLVVHYITAHGYLPPEEFSEAVLRAL
jgi:hypothetical protein